MKLLLLGSGGREHALAWKIAQSPKVEKLYIAPGNAGTSSVGENVNIKATDFNALKAFVLKENISMIVVGPEDPLVEGIYDYFQGNPETQHIAIIGPTREGARLEGSKEFAKEFMISLPHVIKASQQTHWKKVLLSSKRWKLPMF